MRPIVLPYGQRNWRIHCAIALARRAQPVDSRLLPELAVGAPPCDVSALIVDP